MPFTEDSIDSGSRGSPARFPRSWYNRVNRRPECPYLTTVLNLDRRNRRKFYPNMLILAWLAGTACSAAGAEGQRLAPTEATDIGIFYAPGAPETRNLWRDGDPGERLLLRGRVLTTGGAPVSGAGVELWHADGNGEVHPDRYRTRLRSGANGEFGVTTALPGYIPGAPGVWGARHIHVVVTHPGYPELISLILFEGDPNLAGLPYPELAVFVEQGRIKDQTVQFAEVVLILQSN